MNQIKPKHDLRYISDVSQLVGLVVLQIKGEFKNVDLNKIKQDNELIVFTMNLIEAGIIVDKIISKKLIQKLDKNKLVIDIFEAMFETITEDDKIYIEKQIQFILNNKLLRNNNFFLRFFRNLYRRVRNYFVV
jgi:hypothetical protein